MSSISTLSESETAASDAPDAAQQRGRDAQGALPEWFERAVSNGPVDCACVGADGLSVHYLRWSSSVPSAKPGLVLVHGSFAHAHWWDFIAPFFTDDFDVIAVDLPGCGDSAHADQYAVSAHAQSVLAALDHAGLTGGAGGRPLPFLVGHSFGARVCMSAGGLRPRGLGGVVCLDAVVHVAEPAQGARRGPAVGSVVRYAPTLADAVRRFRLQPPQRCDNGFLVRHIAERSVHEVEGKGWTFKFDRMWHQNTKRESAHDREGLIGVCQCPLAWVYGERSFFYRNPKMLELVRGALARHHPSAEPVAVEGAAHHLFLDKPLETVECVRHQLALLKERATAAGGARGSSKL